MDDENFVYLVSAAHVLFKNGLTTFDPALGETVYVTALGEGNTSSKLELHCQFLMEDGNLAKHSKADVAVARLTKMVRKETPESRFKLFALRGVREAESTGTGGFVGLDKKNAKLLSQVSLAADVLLFGYPTSLAGDNFDRSTPLLRTGIVAGVTKTGHIIIDCPSYFGNSGGLVVEVGDEGISAIGVVSKMVPLKEQIRSSLWKEVGVRYENSGYTIIEPMDRVLELIAGFPDLPED